MSRIPVHHPVRRRCVVALVAALSASLAGACSRAAASKSVGPDVMAVVDGHEIHRDDVEKVFRGAVQSGATPSDLEKQTMELSIIDDLITQEILLARAKTLSVEATDSDVENALADRKRSMSEDAFAKELTDRGLTVDDIKRGLRRELSVQKVLDHDVTSKIIVTDQDVTDYFNKNRAQFNFAEPQYRLAQIVVTSVRDAQVRNRMNDDAGSPDEAKKKIEMITAKLQAGGDFGEVAMDYSEDPQTAPQGGDLGFMPASALNRFSPQVRDLVLKMQPGTINTLTMGTNYTIVMLVAREPAGQRDLSTPNVRDGIRDMLKTRREELLHTAYVAAARSDAAVNNYFAHQVVADETKAAAAGALTPAAK